MSFKASTLSAWVVKALVVNSGTPSRGLGGRTSPALSSAEDMVARLEGPRGGRVWQEDG